MTKDEITKDSDRLRYWNNYYHLGEIPSFPSQFAVFFVNEVEQESVVIELGSGNGRDAFFLTNFFKFFLAIDGSEMAINSCLKKAKNGSINNLKFISSFIDDKNLLTEVESELKKFSNKTPVIFYSRFFLHSLTEEEENRMIELINGVLSKTGGSAFLEFRTKKDEILWKETGKHFRRYIEPNELIEKFIKLDFSVKYFVQGFGFAKYRKDDAHVARLVLEKNKN